MSAKQNSRASPKPPGRKPAARGTLPGRFATDAPRPPNFIEQARGKARAPGAAPPARRTPPIVVDETRRAPPAAPPVQQRQTPTQRKPATTFEELVPQIVRYAIKRDEGLGATEFDEKLMPRIRAMVPKARNAAEREVLQDYLLAVAHALYVAIIVGQFSARPLLCGVRAAELAADLAERVLHQVGTARDTRLAAIRGRGLLVGLALYAVRLLETTILNSQSLRGFTDRYERALIITFGLKTQAEATGAAPWSGQKGKPLDGRIIQAVNAMSGMFGEYIGRYGQSMDERHHDEVLREFNGFMERFANYLEEGRGPAEEARRRLARQTASQASTGKFEPLEIKEVRARPAGVEIRLADGRVLFASREDSKRIGQAAVAEAEDTARRDKAAMEAKLNSPSGDN